MNSNTFTPSDIIEKCRHSLIHHGSQNNRIYVMHLDPQDMPTILDDLYELAQTNHYSKIICKVPESLEATFTQRDYIQEGIIPAFFSDNTPCLYMCYYLDSNRKIPKDTKHLSTVLKTALAKPSLISLPDLTLPFTIRILNANDTPQMTKVFKKAFDSYPFPIFDEAYLQDTMEKNIIYFGLFKHIELIGIASCETDVETKTSEMTDFAIDPKYRGYNFALYLLEEMEQYMRDSKFKTLYTIARANSYGMNITFSKQGYRYGGLLKNNTHIGGQLESMNIWYKSI